ASAKIVEVVKKIIGAVKAGAKALIAWWKRTVRFSADGETHSLFFHGDPKSASLRVASDEMSLRDFLKQARTDKKDEETIGKIEKLQDELDELRKKRNPSKPDDPSDQDADINAKFDSIAQLMPNLFSVHKWRTDANPLH